MKNHIAFDLALAFAAGILIGILAMPDPEAPAPCKHYELGSSVSIAVDTPKALVIYTCGGTK